MLFDFGLGRFGVDRLLGSGRFLNIEMQRLEHDYFIDRTILYKAFLVIKGRKEMEESAEFKALPKKEREKRRFWRILLFFRVFTMFWFGNANCCICAQN